MPTIREKLKSKSGVSMVIALIFLLLCAMVGTLVLAAASVSAGKLSRERQYYRQTLALTSAAKLLSRQVQGMTFTGSYVKTDIVTTTVTEDEGGNPSTKVETKSTVAPAGSALSNAAFLTALAEKLDALCQSKQSEGAVTIPESAAIVFQGNAAQNIPEVTGTLTLDGDYGIRVVLTCEDNSMSLVFRAQSSTVTEAGKPTTEVSDDGKTTIRTTLTTDQTIVTWGAPTIAEGGEAA